MVKATSNFIETGILLTRRPLASPVDILGYQKYVAYLPCVESAVLPHLYGRGARLVVAGDC